MKTLLLLLVLLIASTAQSQQKDDYIGFTKLSVLVYNYRADNLLSFNGFKSFDETNRLYSEITTSFKFNRWMELNLLIGLSPHRKYQNRLMLISYGMGLTINFR